MIGCLWWVSPKPTVQACWRCLVVPVLLRLGVPLEISALGGDVLRPSYVLFWWAGCAWVVDAWILLSASGGAWWMCNWCGVHIVWVGVLSLSLCRGDMISGLLPRIYPTILLVVPIKTFMHSFN